MSNEVQGSSSDRQMATAKAARLVAFYLPQFHPIPENNTWWGPGFTEWTNVVRAKPLFPDHYQPHLPADLGFYDLRVPETRVAQAEMARNYGIEAFCYWHYWFAGERLLGRPFDEVLRSGEPHFPFCLAWANDSWTGVWHGAPGRVLKQQTYPGARDHSTHFTFLATAFADDRYLKVEGKPVFVIYHPKELPDSTQVTDLWRELAHRAGFPGLHLVGVAHAGEMYDPADYGLDALTMSRLGTVRASRIPARLKARLLRQTAFARAWKAILGRPVHVYFYEDAVKDFVIRQQLPFEYYPCLIPNWDNTPRSGPDGLVLHRSSPDLFSNHVEEAIRRVRSLPPQRRIVFVKSWNEWAEGNHLEPDQRDGKGYLEALHLRFKEGSR